MSGVRGGGSRGRGGEGCEKAGERWGERPWGEGCERATGRGSDGGDGAGPAMRRFCDTFVPRMCTSPITHMPPPGIQKNVRVIQTNDEAILTTICDHALHVLSHDCHPVCIRHAFHADPAGCATGLIKRSCTYGRFPPWAQPAKLFLLRLLCSTTRTERSSQPETFHFRS